MHYLDFGEHLQKRLRWTLFCTSKYNVTKNTISFSVSKISFVYLMTPIYSTNDQNICVELFNVTSTH